jgi:hypothetical protein
MASSLFRQNPILPRLGFVLPPLLENFLTPTLTSLEPTLSFTRASMGEGVDREGVVVGGELLA